MEEGQGRQKKSLSYRYILVIGQQLFVTVTVVDILVVPSLTRDVTTPSLEHLFIAITLLHQSTCTHSN